MCRLVRHCVSSLVLSAVWVLMASGAMAGIAGTAHDLGTSVGGGEICKFCHVPHNVTATRLLWNHTLSSNNFSWSDATKTYGGTDLPTNIKTWSGSSKNCLACHDGSVALGDLTSGLIGDADNKITGSAKIGPDLKGNHPVSVPYPEGGVKNTYNSIETGDDVPLGNYVSAPATVRIYHDGGGAADAGIECASCHEPHNDTLNPFLRITKDGSAICLACHAY